MEVELPGNPCPQGASGPMGRQARASGNQTVLGGDSLKPAPGRGHWGWGCTDEQKKVVRDGKGFRGEGTVSKTWLWETPATGRALTHRSLEKRVLCTGL